MSNRTQVRNDVYQRLKFWDKKRAQILKHHKKSVEQIDEFLEKRMADSKQYIFNIENLLEYRVKQLKSISQNSILNSNFVLQKNKATAYQAHYQVLKELIGIQATQIKQNDLKLKKVSRLYQQIKQFTKPLKPIKQNNQDQSSSQLNNKLDDQMVITKGNIRYLIDCQLQEIVSDVIQLGGKVSNSFNNYNKKNVSQKQDLYISMLQFVHQTHKQSAKHRQIGRQLITLSSATMKKQIEIQHKIRQYLNKWSAIQQPININSDNSIQQIKQGSNITAMIKSYYDLNQVANIQFQQPTIEDFLINFRIDPYTDHERLCLCHLQAIYDTKIETIVLITSDNYVHLLRMNNPKPDFSFTLNQQLQITKLNDRTVSIIQQKKWMYFKKQVEFQFQLEFITEEQLTHFKEIIMKISSCKIK